MHHHRHVPRCRYHRAARRCRVRCSACRPAGRPVTRPSAMRGTTSRIGAGPIRDSHGDEAAGQKARPALGEEPDCWGKLVVKLLRLIGGRR